MTRRIRNALIGAVIAVAVWLLWSFVRHAVLDGSLAIEHIGRAIPAALLGAIAGYTLTSHSPTVHRDELAKGSVEPGAPIPLSDLPERIEE